MLRDRESWDTYSALGQLFQSDPGAFGAVSLVTGRITGRALEISGGVGGDFARYYSRPLSGNFTEGYHGFSYRLNSAGGIGATRVFAMSGPSGSAQMGLRVNADRSISICRDTTALATTPSPVLVPLAWHRIELFVVQDDAAGQYALRVDGSTVIPLVTGADTRNGADTTFTRVTWGNLQGVNTTVDDYTFNDSTGSVNNSWLGDLCIETLRPNADVSINWTRNVGTSNWDAVDEQQLSTGEFLSTASLVKDRLGLTNLTGTPATIFGISSIYHADKNGAGPSSMRANLNSGGSIANGTTRNMNTSAFTYMEPITELDPQGSVAWSAARVNALDVEIERVT